MCALNENDGVHHNNSNNNNNKCFVGHCDKRDIKGQNKHLLMNQMPQPNQKDNKTDNKQMEDDAVGKMVDGTDETKHTQRASQESAFPSHVTI